MQTKDDISYGVIPIKKFGDEWKVFLIHQYSRIGNNTYWILPKGHPEAGESGDETAKRELFEETGMVCKNLLADKLFELNYNFMFDGVKINKKVVYFIGEIEQTDFTLQPDEVVEADWFSLDKALNRLDYQGTKKMFKEAVEFIKTSK